MKTIPNIFVLISVLMLSCNLTVSMPATRSTNVPLPDLANSSISQLVDTVTTGATMDAVFATQEVLARAGVATTDLATVFLEAHLPAATMIASPEESLHLAMEAQQKETAGTLNVEQLGQMLSDFGWPFPTDRTPGETMVGFFAVWVSEAQKDPENPHSFTPLFLAEMAARQVPSIDLAKGDAPPESIRLAMLELELIAAAFDRGVVPVPTSTGKAPGLAITSPLQIEEPCTTAKKFLAGPWFGQVADVINAELTGISLEMSMKFAGVSDDNVGAFGDALAALGIAAKIWKTVMYYSNNNLQVEGLPSSVHKPNEDENPGDKLIVFIARAGVKEEDWEEFKKRYGSGKIGQGLGTAERAVRDCLSAYGLPTLTDIGDITKDSENWRVNWTIKRGGEHVQFNLAQNDEFIEDGKAVTQPKMKREGEISVTSTYVLEPKLERKIDHPGQELNVPLEVCAELVNSSPISLSTLVNAAKGGLGLVDSIAEVAAGWLQTFLKPSNCSVVIVSYHQQSRFLIEGTVTTTYWFELDLGPGITESGTIHSTFSIPAEISSGGLNGTGEGAYTFDSASTSNFGFGDPTSDADYEDHGYTWSCAKSGSTPVKWEAVGELSEDGLSLNILLKTVTDGQVQLSVCNSVPGGPLLTEPKAAFQFTIPVPSQIQTSYHFVFTSSELPADDPLFVSGCEYSWSGYGDLSNCEVTITWGFVITLLPPNTP